MTAAAPTPSPPPGDDSWGWPLGGADWATAERCCPEVRAAAPRLRLADVSVRGAHGPVLAQVDLRVAAGEHWAVLGPNGAGKSTLLRLAAGLRHPTAGCVEVLGARLGRVDVRALRGLLGVLTDEPGHPAGLTALQAVLSGYTGSWEPLPGRYGSSQCAEAADLLTMVGCAHLATRPMAQCSTGERQRVALARVAAGRPWLVLLDEPTAGLDYPGREAFLAALAVLARRRPEAASLQVAHHLEDLPPTTTHAALLRAGRLLAAGPVEEVLTDQLLAATFAVPLAVHRHAGRFFARPAQLRPE